MYSAKRKISCGICSGFRMYYAFSICGYRLLECEDCGFLTMSPQPTNEDLAAIYGRNYTLMQASQKSKADFSALKRATASRYLHLLSRYRGKIGGRLLEIGCGSGDLLSVALELGYSVTGVEYSAYSCDEARQRVKGAGPIIQGEIETINDWEESFDICILSDVIEHVRDPRLFLERIYRLLAKDGVIFIATPSLDSASAKFMKSQWIEFKAEHLHYFNQNTLHSLLFQCGFTRTVPSAGIKALSFSYVLDHFEKYPIGKINHFLSALSLVVPSSLRSQAVNVVASGMVAMASKSVLPDRRKLSIIIPAYNEAKTLRHTLNRVLEHHLDGLDKEIILVESKSTDGTYEIAKEFQHHPQVKLILEEQPRGKGHAVRTGLAKATGDFILIQDADLEYDVEDYEVLLEPLITGRAAFVLGARHGGKIWKLRSFEENKVTSKLLNFGHWIFKTLLNVMFGLSLNDPFTMYKVFRRDCLSGLKLECNRFDLDFELVIKLARIGYRPLEIPVNYRSRSFAHGKKVLVFRDPLTWLRALLRFRFQPLSFFHLVDNVHPISETKTIQAAQSFNASP